MHRRVGRKSCGQLWGCRMAPKSEEVGSPIPRTCVSVPLVDKRDFVGVIRLKNLKMGESPGLSSWTLSGEGRGLGRGGEREERGRTQSPLCPVPLPHLNSELPATQILPLHNRKLPATPSGSHWPPVTPLGS